MFSAKTLLYRKNQVKLFPKLFAVIDSFCYKTKMLSSQCRAARALLSWGQDTLIERAQVSTVTIRSFENGHTRPHRATLAQIQTALEAAGVEFTNGDAPGVRLKAL